MTGCDNIDRKLRRHDPERWNQLKQKKIEEQKRSYPQATSESKVSSDKNDDCCSGYQASSHDAEASLKTDTSDDSDFFTPQSSSEASLHDDSSMTSTSRQWPEVLWQRILCEENLCDWLRSLPNEALSALSPSPPLQSDPRDFKLELVLSHVQVFSEWRLSTGLQGLCVDDTLDATSTANKNFWRNVKNCIYLYKLGDVERAKPLLSQICSVSSEVILNPSLEFVRSLFDAFSPVNFRQYPEVRAELLCHFTKMAKKRLGPEHRVTIMCQQLQKDDDSRNTTEMALSCMYSSMVRFLSPMAFDTERLIIALLRRDKALGAAADKASRLLTSSKIAPTADSIETRKAAMELAHVYMDDGKLKMARELCMRRVGRAVARDGLVGHEYEDSHAIWALEDLAKIEELGGAFDRSAIWLGHAAELAKRVMGPSVGLTHILDKWEKSLRRCGRDEDAEIARRQYASYTWTENMDVTKN